jgi:hypothetical protein
VNVNVTPCVKLSCGGVYCGSGVDDWCGGTIDCGPCPTCPHGQYWEQGQGCIPIPHGGGGHCSGNCP